MTERLTPECKNCIHWERANPEDETAPEGNCSKPKWEGPLWLNGKGKGAPTFGYHPSTLRSDFCAQHAYAKND